MSTLERAIQIASEAHAGQLDKGGAPYVGHPIRVMNALSTENEKIVGILHDVCEDSPQWNFERLSGEGFSAEVVEALASVTKRPGEAYPDFVRRAAANPIGRRVKIADLKDNSDLGRIGSPTQKDHDRLRKYSEALALLESLGPC
jgi:(p)ppGpp synthase/HD superfamily hydrolase